MVAHLLRLKLTLLRNSFRRSTWALLGVILAGIYGLGMLGLLVVGLIFLGAADPSMIRNVLVIGGSAVVLGWTVVPIVSSGIDMTLDPARFVTFAVPMRELVAGLSLGAVIGIPGIITLLASLAQVGTWIRYPAAAAAAAVCAVLAVLLCVVASRTAATAVISLTSSRRFKDVSSMVVLVPLILLGPIIAGITAGFEQSPGFANELAVILGWTPLGYFWAVPPDVADGAYLTAAIRFGLGIATLAALAWLWRTTLARALVTPAYNAVTRKGAGNLGFFSRFPATPTGAVAARALTYWARDPRYLGSIVIVPLMPLLMLFWSYQSGDYTMLNFVGPIIAFLLAWSISADISYDNTAFWLHLSTGVTGQADRAGRALAVGVLSAPAVLVFTVAPLGISGSLEELPLMLGLSVGVLLTGIGFASVVSARYTYNVPLPGESAMKTPPGTGFSMLAIQLIGWVVLLVLILPEMGFAIAYYVTGNSAFGWLTLVVGCVLGTAFLIGGVKVGGRWYDRRAPELLQAVSVNK
ncbi:transporter [Arthrobacter sp. TMN-50]